MKNQIKLLLSAVALVGFQAQAQVVNGGFETGNFAGWTQFGNEGATGVVGNFDGVNPIDGNYQGAFGSVGSTGGIEQSVAGVTAGNTYELSFWLADLSTGPSYFDVTFGGQDLLTMVNPEPFGYTHYTFAVPVTSDLLAFTFQQNPSYFLIDDITVNAGVPDSGSTMAMMSLGLVGLGGAARRFRR